MNGQTYHLRNRKRPTQHSILKNGQKNHQNEETNTPMFRAAFNKFNDCSFLFRNEWEKSFWWLSCYMVPNFQTPLLGGSGMIDYAINQANGFLFQLQFISVQSKVHQSQFKISSCHIIGADQLTIRFSGWGLYLLHTKAWFCQNCSLSALQKMTICLKTFPIFKWLKI